jgi:hypothetical protein
MSTKRRRSFNVTSAARVNKLDVTPLAISDMLRMEQGAIIMPRVGKEPDAMLAAMSPGVAEYVARALISAIRCSGATRSTSKRYTIDSVRLR